MNVTAFVLFLPWSQSAQGSDLGSVLDSLQLPERQLSYITRLMRLIKRANYERKVSRDKNVLGD